MYEQGSPHGHTQPERDTASYYDGSSYDPQTVAFYDIAHEGAHVRALAGNVDKLGVLYGLRPRSLVVITTDHLARACARFVSALRSPLRVPLVITDSLPSYVGALDVVVVIGERAVTQKGEHALSVAARRGAITILVGPGSGPIVEEAPREAIIVDALPNTLGASPARNIAALASILDLMEEDPGLVVERLKENADAIDAELVQLSPERDEVVNPARQLRAFVGAVGAGGVAGVAKVLHTGEGGDWHSYAVAELLSDIWNHRGLVSGFFVPEELSENAHLQQAATSQDIFHDPFLDDDPGLLPLRTIVWAIRPDISNGDSVPAGLNALRVSLDTPGVGPMAAALKLIVRGLAATIYQEE